MVGPITAAEWLRLEGLSQSVAGVLEQAWAVLASGETGMHLISAPQAEAYIAFAGEHAENFDRLISGLRDGSITVDWQRAGAVGGILRRALAVAHPWPTAEEQALRRDFRRRADGTYSVIGGWLSWSVTADKLSAALAADLRFLGAQYRASVPGAIEAAVNTGLLAPEEQRRLMLKHALIPKAKRRRWTRRPKIVIEPTAGPNTAWNRRQARNIYRRVMAARWAKDGTEFVPVKRGEVTITSGKIVVHKTEAFSYV